MSREHRCWRNLAPLMFRLFIPCGPSVLLSGSFLSLVVPTLQLMSWPNIICVPVGSLLINVCVMPLNSSCSFESTGWYIEHSIVFIVPLMRFPWLSLRLKCSCTPRNRPSYLWSFGRLIFLLSASLYAASISGLSMMHTPPMTCPSSLIFLLGPCISTLWPSI